MNIPCPKCGELVESPSHALSAALSMTCPKGHVFTLVPIMAQEPARRVFPLRNEHRLPIGGEYHG